MRILKVLIVLLFTCVAFDSLAQITSGTIVGKVLDESQEGLPGANVVAIHEPTGTTYGVSTQINGDFVLTNLKTGGPYRVTASFIGYKDNVQKNIVISIGSEYKLNFQMQPNATTLEGFEVVHDKNDVFNGSKSGYSTTLDRSQLEKTPTLNRSLQDVTRLAPSGGQSSFGGSNYRYNNLSIDGASNNDALGFQEPASGAAGTVASGTPGALAGTQPISLDAVEEISVALAPFDVKQGNSTGANINAVTRSGTNQLHGSIYGFGRNQIITGKSVDDSRTPIADYHDFQSGFRIGGPIKKNKAFVFLNYETARRSEPVLNAPGDISSNIPLEIAQQISDTLRSRYGYDPGSFGALDNERLSDKFFLRFDFNLGKKHQLVIRDNFVTASADQLERTSSSLNFESQGFTHHSNTNSLVTELKSQFNSQVSNHLIVGFNSVNDRRTFSGDVFPHVQITYNTSNSIFLGTFREASIFGVGLNTTQITDNLSIYKNKHTITVGTNNDIYAIEYRFLTAWNGRWEYSSLENFFADQPRRIRGVYHFDDNSFDFNRNNPSADFHVLLLSGYVQDKYKVNDRLSVTGGIRLDLQVQPDKVEDNPEVLGTPAFNGFNNDFGGVPQINPRFSFSWTINEKETHQLRGGSGLFTGRIPFAWYAYAHYISGINYGNIDLKPDSTLPITTNLSDLRAQQPNLAEINLIDNDFKLPRIWSTNIAWDWKLAKGFTFSLEALYSKTLNDVLFQSLNLKDSTASFSGADDRTYYLGSGEDRRINPNFTNVFLLTNTNQGYKYNVTVSISKQFGIHGNLFAAYTYGESKDLVNGVRNSLAANFNRNQAVNPNQPDLAYSNFDVRHRVIGSGIYNKQWSDKHKSSFNVIYTAQAGSPFSFIYSGDLNNDGASRNDLVYVPASQDEIVLQPITDANGAVLVSAQTQWEQLDAYIENDPYLSTIRGEYSERNGGRTPWNNQIDLRFSHYLYPNKDHNDRFFEFTLDIINFGNLLNREWGLKTFVPNRTNSSFQLLDFKGIENGEPTFQFDNLTETPWQVDPFNSRWQAQLGIRYTF